MERAGGRLEIEERLEVDDEAATARATTNIRGKYEASSATWRSGRATLLNIALIACIAASLPSVLPGPAWLIWAVYGVIALASVSATIAHERFTSRSVAYLVATTFESSAWILGHALLIMTAPSAVSFYWVLMALVVVVCATTIERHHVLLRLLVLAGIAVVGAFAWRAQWADVGISIALAGSLVWFQRLATITGWRAELERARAQLLTERASELLVADERARLARELHDGLGAELTSLLWQAQALEGAEVAELVSQVRASLGQLRAATQSASRVPMRAEALADECERIARMVAGACCVVFERALDPPDRLVAPADCVDVMRCAQEGVRNAVTHGHAKNIRVSLRFGDELVLIVHDDGIGIDAKRIGRGGTRHIRERAKRLGGHATWSSDEGTIMEVRAPARVSLRELVV